MKKNILLALGLVWTLVGCKALIPAKYRTFIDESGWKRISRVKTGVPSLHCDSTLVLFSNRKVDTAAVKFMGDDIDLVHEAKVVLAQTIGGQTTIYPFARLDDALEYLPTGKPLVVYTEGMGKNFPLNIERGMAMKIQHGVNVVMMDYPSIHAKYGLFKNFTYARKSSMASAPFLGDLWKKLNQYSTTHPTFSPSVTLFHHSMGNLMLQKAIEEQRDTIFKQNLCFRLVLNAPCVTSRNASLWLSKQQLGKEVYVHYNKEDKQLNGAKILLFKTQLGVKIKDPAAPKINYVDFNPLVQRLHSTFIDIPNRPPINQKAERYFSTLFQGSPIDWSDSTRYIRSPNGPGFALKP